ncbi:MAG: hypothetical protein GY858_04545, partial [Candidatus Omnitrophica bacterium]|nr:hypothetical protein [Candidatus Omnitrophota bacterium]
MKYLNASHLAQRAKRSAKFQKENDILESADISRFWNFIRSRLVVKSRIPVLKEGGKVFVSAEERATLINDYFASVFVHDDGNLPSLLFPESVKTISTIDFSPELVYAYLCLLPSKTSSGPDGIPTIFLKCLCLVMAEPLSLIFKISFSSSQLPSDWLAADVVPIYKKKGNPSSHTSYRPISLTSNPGKVDETMICDIIADHMHSFWHSG